MDARRAILAASLVSLGGWAAAPGPEAASIALVTHGQGAPDWLGRLSSVLSVDLRESGAFLLVEPARRADYVLRLLARPLDHGKVSLACEMVRRPTQTTLLKKVFIGEADALPRLAHRLADRVVGVVTGRPGTADTLWVASVPVAMGVREICSMEPGGGRLRRLTAFGGLSSHPALAPDGRLAFVTYRGGPPQIWGQPSLQGPLQRLYPAGGGGGRTLKDLAWSPDGTRLAFVEAAADGKPQVKVLDLGSRAVTAWTGPGVAAHGPTWSPDGKQIAYLADPTGVDQVYRLALPGGPAIPVTRDPAPKTSAAWGPGGDLIAYAVPAGTGSRLCVAAPDGTGERVIAAWTEPVAALCWAPDQRRLLLSLRQGRHARLRVVGLDGAQRELPEAVQGDEPQWVRNPAALAQLVATGAAATPSGAPRRAPF